MRKLLSVIISVLLVSTLFVGCTTASNTPGQQSTKQPTTTLNIATNAEFAPYESVDEATGDLVGFDIDLIKAIANKIGAKVEFQNMNFDSVLAAIQSGKSDVAISGLTITPDRAKSVDFSSPYFSVSQNVIVRTDDTVFTGTTKEDIDKQLVGKKIGVCAGFTGETYVKGNKETPGIKNADVKVYNNISLAIADLKNKAIDAIVMDSTVAVLAASAVGNKDAVKVIPVKLTSEDYGIAVKKGNTELLNKINNAFSELKAAGEVDKITNTWFGK